MAHSLDGVLKNRTQLSSVPYSGCDTRIISLLDVDIPDQATEDGYRAIYSHYVKQASIDDKTSNAAMLRDAIESIRYGIAPPVAFPTETVYGLGADAMNEPAISGIFAAKGRPSDNPLIVHIASIAHLERVTGSPLPEVYRPVAEQFWPGPLTILLPVPQSGIFAKNVHPAQSTIGFRIPSSKYARFFIAATDKPIAGPSANSSGKPSPTTARHVLDDLRGKINFILDGGSCEVGVESTVVDGLHDPPLVLRPGGVGLEELRALGREIGGDVGARWARTSVGYKEHHVGSQSPGEVGNGTLASHASSSPSKSSTPTPASSSTNLANGIAGYDEINGAPRAPGMKYRHYSPQGRLILFSEDAFQAGRVRDKMQDILEGVQSIPTAFPEQNKSHKEVKVGIISCHWPPFADLEGAFPATTGSTCINDVDGLRAEEPKPDIILRSAYADITSMVTVRQGSTDVTLYNVHLGPQISTLAHSLFGVLRLFDDLDCAYIFAETVQRRCSIPSFSPSPAPSPEPGSVNGQGCRGNEQQAQRDLEGAVIDRIEKAAAERVD